MSQVTHSILDLIGNTPLLELHRIEAVQKIDAQLLAKLEGFNPAGSVKDRIARGMILDAESRGVLSPGGTIIEPTSGNTGIGLAAIGAARGYRVILVMPDTMSIERRNLLRAYGAEVVLTEGAKGMKGAIAKAEELSRTYPGSFIPSQFLNQANPESHIISTGPEIWSQTDGKLDFLIAGVGTGGTITGNGKYLKERNPNLQVVAVEPIGSAVLSGQAPGPHKIQGIGAGFIPEVMDTSIVDETIQVSNEDALICAQLLAKKEGILAGISSGAALWAAMEIARRPENQGKRLVMILPDSGERYLTVPGFLEKDD